MLLGVVDLASQERTGREWRYYGGDHAFTRYAPFDQITRDNVKNVTIAWTRPAVNPALTNAFPDLKVNAYLKSTPIVVDGVIYTQDAHGLVTAFDGATGKTIWEQEAPKEEAAGDPTRGLDTWGAGDAREILAGPPPPLVAMVPPCEALVKPAAEEGDWEAAEEFLQVGHVA